MNKYLPFILIVLLLIYCKPIVNKFWNYPYIKADTAYDVYFEDTIIDPYRNLEDLTNPDVVKWTLAQRKFYDSIMSGISHSDSLYKELNELFHSVNISAGIPRTAENGIFYKQSNEKENVYSLLFVENQSNKKTELFNTKKLNKKYENTFTIDYYEPSYNGKYIAFGLSCGGDENSTIYVIDVETKEILPERIERAMGGNPQWIPDGSGFFYQQFRETKNNYEDACVRFHVLRTDPAMDKEIFSRRLNTDLPINKIDFPLIYTYPSSDYILAAVNPGTSMFSSLYFTHISKFYSKPAKNIDWKKICSFSDKIKYYSIKGNSIFTLSYAKNPLGMIEEINLQDTSQRKIIIKGNEMPLDQMIQTRNALYVTGFKNGYHLLTKIDLENDDKVDIKLSGYGSAYIIPFFEVPSFYQHSENLYFGFESWNKGYGIYYVDDKNNQVVRTDYIPAGKYDNPAGLIVEEVEVKSYDGTMVPLSIIYNSKLKKNGNNPTIIEAYGAYGYSLTPFFDISLLSWFNRGGIYAVTHVRGGGEKGETWYREGYKQTKPNSWKDYIACSEYLVKNRYTSAKKMAGFSYSAGGITVGRAFTERPDLYKAVVINVGSMNIVRIDHTTATANINEFGSAKDSAEFQYLYEMDVYHHIKNDINYPSVLFTAALNDARIDMWEVTKIVAKMQSLKQNKNIVLLRVSDEGHFGDTDYIKEKTGIFSFLLWQLGDSEFQPAK